MEQMGLKESTTNSNPYITEYEKPFEGYSLLLSQQKSYYVGQSAPWTILQIVTGIPIRLWKHQQTCQSCGCFLNQSKNTSKQEKEKEEKAED